MAKTQAAINIHLPSNLAEIVHGYLLPSSWPMPSEIDIGRAGHVELMRNAPNRDKIFAGACRSGDIDLVKEMLEQGAKMSIGFIHACRGGHRDVIDLLIERGVCDWENGLTYACVGGHYDIAYSMIKRGAKNWNIGLMGACASNHTTLIATMIALGANNWNMGLYGACFGGQIAVIQMMINHGATNWNYGLNGACHGDSREALELMIGLGANHWLNECFIEACSAGSIQVATYLIRRGEITTSDLNNGLTKACHNLNYNIIELTINTGATRCDECYRSLEDHIMRIRIRLMQARVKPRKKYRGDALASRITSIARFLIQSM